MNESQQLGFKLEELIADRVGQLPTVVCQRREQGIRDVMGKDFNGVDHWITFGRPDGRKEHVMIQDKWEAKGRSQPGVTQFIVNSEILAKSQCEGDRVHRLWVSRKRPTSKACVTLTHCGVAIICEKDTIYELAAAATRYIEAIILDDRGDADNPNPPSAGHEAPYFDEDQLAIVPVHPAPHFAEDQQVMSPVDGIISIGGQEGGELTDADDNLELIGEMREIANAAITAWRHLEKMFSYSERSVISWSRVAPAFPRSIAEWESRPFINYNYAIVAAFDAWSEFGRTSSAMFVYCHVREFSTVIAPLSDRYIAIREYIQSRARELPTAMSCIADPIKNKVEYESMCRECCDFYCEWSLRGTPVESGIHMWWSWIKANAARYVA